MDRVLGWLGQGGAAPKERFRSIHLNAQERNAPAKFCGNRLSTAKYSIITFLPRNLFEQFCRIANLYFLVIAVLMLIPGLSPNSPVTAIGPLSFVLAVNALKEGLEDAKRHRQDALVNARQTEILQGDEFVKTRWTNVRVGDILCIRDGENFPADLIALATSGPDGACFVETMNLDGETNLKPKAVVSATQSCATASQLSLLKGSLRTEQPNNRLYSFEGSMQIEGEDESSIGPAQVLLRGSMLKNTQWVYGIAVFTGRDTKLVRNMTAAPSKRSVLEKRMNRLTAGLFAAMILLCMFNGIMSEVKRAKGVDHYQHFYLPSQDSGFVRVALTFLTFLILLNQFIPISLYVTLEMVKLVECAYIFWDEEMYDPSIKRHAIPHTSNLNEELGQIEYVLSDKTGTLTANEMDLVRCAIGDEAYGAHDDDKEEDNSDKSEGEKVAVKVVEKGENMGLDEKLRKEIKSDTKQGELCRSFFTHLAVCHTVMPEAKDSHDSKKHNNKELTYMASSPDELALVLGAKSVGFKLLSRSQTSVTIANVEGKSETYEVLQTLEFSSDRKRMSVVAREPKTGMLRIYTKGADSVMLPLLKQGEPFVDAMKQRVRDYARLGLRTLLVAQADLDTERYEAWRAEYIAASVALEDRERRVEEVSAKIEQDLTLLGATAVEDKLQDGVPEALADLLAAGIKVWVLTGDKQETAISIGRSCNLLPPATELMVLEASSKDEMAKVLAERTAAARGLVEKGRDVAVVIDGMTLYHALEPELKLDFLQLGKLCNAVICCRVSPLQKALVTKLVKRHAGAVTLAIGDGANDVGMIRAAGVGVGIAGKEGAQAVQASDYSIGQFRFLVRLLLVHGRYAYNRNREVVFYAFYKNMAYNFPQWYFAWSNAFSAQTYYPDLLIATYNTFWTALPTICMAAFDQDLSARTLLRNPSLYGDTQKDKLFFRMFLVRLLNAFFHSLTVYLGPFWALRSATQHGGRLLDSWHAGVTTYSLVVVTVTLKVLLHSCTLTWLNHFVIWGSIAAYFAFLAVMSQAWSGFGVVPDMNNILMDLTQVSAFWWLLLLVPLTCTVVDVAFRHAWAHFRPTRTRVMLEREHGWRDGVKKENGRKQSDSSSAGKGATGLRRRKHEKIGPADFEDEVEGRKGKPSSEQEGSKSATAEQLPARAPLPSATDSDEHGGADLNVGHQHKANNKAELEAASSARTARDVSVSEVSESEEELDIPPWRRRGYKPPTSPRSPQVPSPRAAASIGQTTTRQSFSHPQQSS